jgi:hypothetical protein
MGDILSLDQSRRRGGHPAYGCPMSVETEPEQAPEETPLVDKLKDDLDRQQIDLAAVLSQLPPVLRDDISRRVVAMTSAAMTLERYSILEGLLDDTL